MLNTLKKKNKATFVLACIFFTVMLAGLILTVATEIDYLEISAKRAELESDPSYDPEIGESLGMGLSEGFAAAFSLIFGIFGALAGVLATLFSALTVPAPAKWMKITSIAMTAFSALATLWMFPGVLLVVR